MCQKQKLVLMKLRNWSTTTTTQSTTDNKNYIHHNSGYSKNDKTAYHLMVLSRNHYTLVPLQYREDQYFEHVTDWRPVFWGTANCMPCGNWLVYHFHLLQSESKHVFVMHMQAINPFYPVYDMGCLTFWLPMFIFYDKFPHHANCF